jgi:hypothetical protein
MLASEAALAIAKEKKIADPQKAPECLKCHVTAFPVMADLANQKITLEEGISCESCHGPGSGYDNKKAKDALAAGTATAASIGLLEANEKTCLGCHNQESPTFKEFKYEEAVKKIAHPIPKPKTE